MNSITKNRIFNNINIFTFFNAFLFLCMCIFVYFDRFIKYRGTANIHEFFLYASVIFLVIFLAWVKFKEIKVKTYILLAIQITIFIHFAGAFVEIDGHRLYDFRILSIRYDKFVHFINSFIGAFIIHYLFKKYNVDMGRMTLIGLGFIVLGIGAFIEILEFMVVLTVPHNGVGDYVNNMSDLLANLFGVIIYIFTYNMLRNKKVYEKQ
ncbi:MAG: hypothetical protein CSA86_02525 [Arcobacter sp.]|nr:MAG: hypothetical protein CSA86_02525 [Arcobacter sp.]